MSASLREENVITDFDQALVHYTSLLKDNPDVVNISVYDGDDGQTILTEISAQPFDSTPRDAIYDAIVATYQLMREPVASFRLVNIREFT